LGEILRVVCMVTAAAEVSVDWPPIDLAQLRERRVCAGLRCRTGGDDNAPRCLLEAVLRLVRRAE